MTMRPRSKITPTEVAIAAAAVIVFAVLVHVVSLYPEPDSRRWHVEPWPDAGTEGKIP
jgi:hypothetical protein